MTVCDYLFERDKIYAYLNLDDNELFIYQRLYELLARDVASPDLVVYLQARTFARLVHGQIAETVGVSRSRTKNPSRSTTIPTAE